MQRMRVAPATDGSYERLFHEADVARVLASPARARRGALVRERARCRAPRARHRRRLPARHRAPEPLLLREPPAAVRRVHLVRRDDGRTPAGWPASRSRRPDARHVPVWLVMSTAARSLMASFAERTGLTSNRPPQRYLWTDAFAVCNFLGLDQNRRRLGAHRAGAPRARSTSQRRRAHWVALTNGRR